MNIVQVGDIHIHDGRIEEFREMLQELAYDIKRQEPDLFVFSGDLFVHRDKFTPAQVALAREFFKDMLKGIPQIITVGNHDISMSSEKVDSVSAIFASDFNVYTTVGESVEFDDYVFHMFPYPSKKEMERLNIHDIAEVYERQDIFDMFKLDPNKKNVLVYHGTLFGFNTSDEYKASEEAINVGKECVLPKSFWGMFDAVMAGHLHKFQIIDKAVYAGTPFPLTYKDSFATGYAIWRNLEPSFVEVNQRYPFKTVDIGNVSGARGSVTDEAVRRIQNDDDFERSRVRIKYKINSTMAGTVDHSELTKYFKNAKEIKVVPEYVDSPFEKKDTVSLEDFQHDSIQGVISSYIDSKQYSHQVKEIAKKIEEKILEQSQDDDGKGIHLKINNLNVSNYRSFGEDNPTIYFDNLDKLVGVFGLNRSGKSTLVEAIGWALFGQTNRSKDAKAVVRNGQTQTRVVLEFESYSTRYKVHRERGKKTILNLYVWGEDGWVDISGATVTVTQRQIEKLVGTFDMFISTTYAPQNEVDHLIKKKPSDRKQIILDCLQIDVLEKRQQEAANLRKEVKDLISQTKGKVSTLSDQITSLLSTHPSETINEFENLLQAAETERTRVQVHLNSLSKKVYEYESLNEDLTEIEGMINNVRNQLKDVKLKKLEKENEKKKFEAVLADTNKIEEGIRRTKEADAEVAKYNAEKILNNERLSNKKRVEAERDNLQRTHNKQVSTLNQSRESLMKRLETSATIDCYKPDCPINEKIKKQIDDLRIEVDDIDRQLAEENESYSSQVRVLNSRIADIEKEIRDSFFDEGEYKKWQKAFNDLQNNRWEELQHKVSSKKQILENLSDIITTFDNRYEELREKRDTLTNQRTDVSNKIAAVDKYHKEVEKTTIELDKIKERIENYKMQINKCKNNLETINNLQRAINDAHDELKSLEEHLVHCNKYAEIVSKHGVIFSIVDKSLPIIEQFAQSLLSETTNGLVSLSIDSFKTLASGDKSDEVMIYIIDSKGTRDIAEASGAELVLLSLALRAAMSHLLSMRMGSKVELFIVDEGFGNFDGNNIISIKDMLRQLSEKFNKVLFITHVDELKDVAQSVINVESNDVVSTYSVKGNKRECSVSE